MKYLDRAGLASLVHALGDLGYELVGPIVREGAIVYDELGSPEDLPRGWTDDQDSGRYRLRRREDEALFGYVVGPHSWKRFLFPPTQSLWKASRQVDSGHLQMVAGPAETRKYAFIGVRACELHAIAIQDRVLVEGEHADLHYRSLREKVFSVAVHCTEPGGTCFCGSMETGPRATSGFDLALTELLEGDDHGFIVEVGSESGADLMRSVPHREARAEEIDAAERLHSHAAGSMGRELDTRGIKELFYANYEHRRWDAVAERCTTCGNCTLVCPTCFCTSIEDRTSLTGDEAERVRRWDSCFTMQHAYIHGGSLRGSTSSRYRQWMTHKLATWIDQFGSSGCVGCGRCITWCPVGIDITAEVRSLREEQATEEEVPDRGS